MDDALNLRRFATPQALAEAAAEHVAETLRAAVTSRGRASIALAGGSTPRATYEALARRADTAVWEGVDVFWSDERAVPPSDAASNVGMARAALLDPLGVDESRVHAPQTGLVPADAALRYEHEIRARLGGTTPAFDLVLLGMGDDGHTASLFPGGPELAAPPSRLVVASTAPFDPPERITFTLPLINAARRVLFLVTGQAKRPTLRRVLDGDTTLPAALVAPLEGTVDWFVDEAAASR
jgi:6-phosphogluconolactonase